MKADTGPLVCGNGSKWGRYGCGTRKQPCKECRQEALRLALESIQQPKQESA